ncbi:MAG: VanZ family protein [Desulfobulbaceae bacterium]|nr:VanZ family protein [Desulfobulbaceae bacterium]
MNTTKLILLAVLIFLFPFFFWGGPVYSSSRSLIHFWNIGHIIFFAAATYLIVVHFQASLSTKSFGFQFFWMLFFVLFSGIAIEIAQYGTDRLPDPDDLLRNVIGSFTGLFFFSPSRKMIGKSLLRILQFLVLILLVLEVLPLAAALVDEADQKRKFPVLADFESPLEITRWSGSAEIEIVPDAQGSLNHYLKIKLGTSEYSGVFLKFFPHEWSEFRKLTFTIFNPAPDSFYLTCRIHDRQHALGRQEHSDRFNRSYLLEPGMNTLTIALEDILHAPEARTMNVDEISSVGFFVTRQTKPRIIYLDDLKLIQ